MYINLGDWKDEYERLEAQQTRSSHYHFWQHKARQLDNTRTSFFFFFLFMAKLVNLNPYIIIIIWVHNPTIYILIKRIIIYTGREMRHHASNTMVSDNWVKLLVTSTLFNLDYSWTLINFVPTNAGLIIQSPSSSHGLTHNSKTSSLQMVDETEYELQKNLLVEMEMITALAFEPTKVQWQRLLLKKETTTTTTI